MKIFDAKWWSLYHAPLIEFFPEFKIHGYINFKKGFIITQIILIFALITWTSYWCRTDVIGSKNYSEHIYRTVISLSQSLTKEGFILLSQYFCTGILLVFLRVDDDDYIFFIWFWCCIFPQNFVVLNNTWKIYILKESWKLIFSFHYRKQN